MTPGPPEEGDGTFLTTEDLARRWRMTPGAVHTLKHRTGRPRAVRIGKRNLYRLADVEAFENERQEQ